MSRRALLASALSVLALLLFASASPAMTVTTTSDSPAAGNCSLREAIDAVNSGTSSAACGPVVSGGATSITLPAGHYTLGSTELQIAASADVAIAGADPSDPSKTIIDAGGQNRVLDVASGGQATLTALEITGGKTAAGADADPNVPNVRGGSGGNGGGILNRGTLVLQHVLVTGNQTGKGGKASAGVNQFNGTSAPPGGAGGFGGGISNEAGAALTVEFSTISSNSTGAGGNGGPGAAGDPDKPSLNGGQGGDGWQGGQGGGIYNGGSANIITTTVAGNTTGDSGRGGQGGHGGKETTSGGTTIYASGGLGGRGGGLRFGTSGDGGGIANTGGLSISQSTLSGNTTGKGGIGGVGGNDGDDGTTPDGNAGGGGGGDGGLGGAGGGLYDVSGATLTNVTIQGNTTGAGGDGGDSGLDRVNGGAGGNGGNGGGLLILGNSAAPSLTHVTVSQNQVGIGGTPGLGYQDKRFNPGARGIGAGVDGVQLTVTNTIVAANGDPVKGDQNCIGSLSDGGHDISYPDTSCPGANTDPGLGALADNGGPTKTMLPGAAAIDAIPAASCPVLLDQRVFRRRDDSESSCDIGAVESGAVAPPPGASSTSVSSSANPSTVDQQVNLVATVSPAPDGGTLSFSDGGVTIPGCGKVAIAAGGVAICPDAFSAVGSHSIAASYPGDSSFASSGSATLTQVVNPAPTSTSLSSTPNPSTAGDQVGLIATVSPEPDGGTVSFTDSGVAVPGCDSVAIASGQATCLVTYPSAGSNSIVATYSGDGNFQGSTSGAITQVVNPAGNPGGGGVSHLTHLRLSPSTFRASSLGGSVGLAKKKPPIGSTASFTLDKPTAVLFTVSRVLSGRKVTKKGKTHCVAPTKQNRHEPHCTRTVGVKGSFSVNGTAGFNTFRFTGRLAGKKLAPGSYHVRGAPPDELLAQGASASFTIAP